MTFAEVILLIGIGLGIYRLLRPLQRWLETSLIGQFRARHPRLHRPTIDVTDFTSYAVHKKDEDQHEHRS